MHHKSIKSVKSRMARAFADIREKRTEAAIHAVLVTGGAMAQTLVPVDTTTLINSQYAPVIKMTLNGATGRIGYTAKYAGYVHEKEGTMKGQLRSKSNPGRGKFWSPDAEPKFLTKGFKRVENQIPIILKSAYRV